MRLSESRRCNSFQSKHAFNSSRCFHRVEAKVQTWRMILTRIEPCRLFVFTCSTRSITVKLIFTLTNCKFYKYFSNISHVGNFIFHNLFVVVFQLKCSSTFPHCIKSLRIFSSYHRQDISLILRDEKTKIRVENIDTFFSLIDARKSAIFFIFSFPMKIKHNFFISKKILLKAV